MKLKFVEGGYEHFTGYFGTTYFEDGVSVTDVSDADARVMAAITRVEVVGDGKIVGDNERYLQSYEISAVTVNYPTSRQVAEQRKGGQAPQATVEANGKIESNTDAAATTYTQQMLEEIADKKGIAGLREIGQALGVKATSIAALIEAILSKQAPITTAAAPLAAGDSKEGGDESNEGAGESNKGAE